MTIHPVPVPLLTGLLAERIHRDNEAEGKRPKAFDTLLRNSGAGKCARQLGLAAAGYEESDQPDISGEWVMWLGSLIHEKWQEAAIDMLEFDIVDPEFQVRFGDLTSGHLDARIRLVDGRLVAYELKTRGATGFDRAIGLDRRFFKEKPLEGPTTSDKLQGALNAYAIGADLMVIGIIGLEAVSKAFARKLGFEDLRRIMAEWHYTREEYEPWAIAELDRMEEIADHLRSDVLPPRWAVGDDMTQVELDPDASRPAWQCDYCSHRTTCSYAGPGAVRLPLDGIPVPVGFKQGGSHG